MTRDLLEERLESITNGIAGCKSNLEDIPTTHYKPAAESSAAELSTTHAHLYDLGTTGHGTQVMKNRKGLP